MSGLIRRECICDNCGKSSREAPKRRLIGSAVFLVALGLTNLIPFVMLGTAASIVWMIALVVYEAYAIYAIPLVQSSDSAGWNATKDVFAWGFVGLILATFLFTAIVSLLG